MSSETAQSMKASSASDILKGQPVVVKGVAGHVASITIGRGGQRVITTKEGEKVSTNTAGVAKLVRDSINAQNSEFARKSIRTVNGITRATIGGPVKGERREFKTPAAAKAAITRHYGK